MRTFLLLGQTGVGKSSFVNATFGVDLAETREFEACTKVVEHYARTTAFGDICLVDTPGLSEDNSDLDRRYLNMVRTKLTSYKGYVSLYLTPLNETRLRSSERSALQSVTNELGHGIWRRSWLIMTFGACIRADKLERAIDARTRQIADYIGQICCPRSGFSGFHSIGVVDNVVVDWAEECVPIAEFLSTA